MNHKHFPYLATPLLVLAPLACKSSSSDAIHAQEPVTVGAVDAPAGSVLDALDASELERNLAAAQKAFDSDPTSETNIIWLGRRLAYLGRYEEAIDVYTKGLETHPQSFRILRHRGHRFITTRQFQRAELDLWQAANLIRGVPDEVELDGVFNSSGVPRSTNHSNVYYHLGLALYLQGRYEDALDAYRRGIEYAKVNDDMLVATTHWLYMTLRRLGREQEAERVLEPIHENMEVLENHGYYDCLRMYRGWVRPPAVVEDVSQDTVEFASRGYGIANWYLVNGYADEGRAMLTMIVDGGANPAAFGLIAAEADLERVE